MPGIKEVAELAGVSAATVSRVLSDDLRISAPTRHRAKAAAKESGYTKSFSASGLASGKNWNVGVLLLTVKGWYYSAILEGIADSLLAAGYDLTLYNSAGGIHEVSYLTTSFSGGGSTVKSLSASSSAAMNYQGSEPFTSQ